MKKAAKSKVNGEKRRVATYLEGDLCDWLAKESSDLGLNESAYLRMMVIERKKQREAEGMQGIAG